MLATDDPIAICTWLIAELTFLMPFASAAVRNSDRGASLVKLPQNADQTP
jgi:hypothetical protein